MVLKHVIKLQKTQNPTTAKKAMLATQWSIKSNPTFLTKTQIVNFEGFNNAMPEVSEINTNAARLIFQKFDSVCACDW